MHTLTHTNTNMFIIFFSQGTMELGSTLRHHLLKLEDGVNAKCLQDAERLQLAARAADVYGGKYAASYDAIRHVFSSAFISEI